MKKYPEVLSGQNRNTNLNCSLTVFTKSKNPYYGMNS